MIVAFGWRLRHDREIFGPRPRVQQLYQAARYMPDEAMWEYCDSGGDWFEHITVGQWRRYIKLIRKHWFHSGGPDAAPIDDQSITITYLDFWKKNSADHIYERKGLGGLKTWEKNMKREPWYWWRKIDPDWEQKWNAAMDRARERTRQKIAERTGGKQT